MSEKRLRLPTRPCISIQGLALRNDFYTQPWDWGACGLIAVANERVKLYSPQRGDCTTLEAFARAEHAAMSVRFHPLGELLALGSYSGALSVWDVHANAGLAEASLQTRGGVNALCWKSCGSFLAASTDEGSHEVKGFDLRVPSRSSFCIKGHDGRVCGLQYHPEDRFLAASTNSGSIFVYDGRRLSGCLHRLRHEPSNAAIRGLAFSPAPGSSLLCSGGGTGDRTLRFWDLQTGAQARCVDVGAQVTSLLWPDVDRIVSAQGYAGNNTAIWDARRMVRLGHLPGYPSRVLQVGLSPCGSLLATSGDGSTLDIWKAFPAKGPPSSLVDAADRLPPLRTVGLELLRAEERRERGPLAFGPAERTVCVRHVWKDRSASDDDEEEDEEEDEGGAASAPPAAPVPAPAPPPPAAPEPPDGPAPRGVQAEDEDDEVGYEFEEAEEGEVPIGPAFRRLSLLSSSDGSEFYGSLPVAPQEEGYVASEPGEIGPEYESDLVGVGELSLEIAVPPSAPETPSYPRYAEEELEGSPGVESEATAESEPGPLPPSAPTSPPGYTAPASPYPTPEPLPASGPAPIEGPPPCQPHGPPPAPGLHVPHSEPDTPAPVIPPLRGHDAPDTVERLVSPLEESAEEEECEDGAGSEEPPRPMWVPLLDTGAPSPRGWPAGVRLRPLSTSREPGVPPSDAFACIDLSREIESTMQSCARTPTAPNFTYSRRLRSISSSMQDDLLRLEFGSARGPVPVPLPSMPEPPLYPPEPEPDLYPDVPGLYPAEPDPLPFEPPQSPSVIRSMRALSLQTPRLRQPLLDLEVPPVPPQQAAAAPPPPPPESTCAPAPAPGPSIGSLKRKGEWRGAACKRPVAAHRSQALRSFR